VKSFAKRLEPLAFEAGNLLLTATSCLSRFI
jgi:hypothetical protein